MQRKGSHMRGELISVLDWFYGTYMKHIGLFYGCTILWLHSFMEHICLHHFHGEYISAQFL